MALFQLCFLDDSHSLCQHWWTLILGHFLCYDMEQQLAQPHFKTHVLSRNIWLPTCVFAKHLAHGECCNVPDLLTEAANQPYVTTQTVWVMSKIFIVINKPVWNYLEILFSPAARAAHQNSFCWGRSRLRWPCEHLDAALSLQLSAMWRLW